MCKKLILQIGRFDRNFEDSLTFVYDNKEYKSPLSSLALKSYFDNAKLILIYPVSLLLNKNFINLKEDGFFSRLNLIHNDENEKEKYLKNPEDFFINHPHSKLVDDFICIHSIGEYENVKFESKLEDFILYLLVFLLKEYLKNPFEELYVDISSGLNLYITALIESLKYFNIWSQFYNRENESNKVKTFIIYTDPIIGGSSKIYNIYMHEIKTKAFFDSPISYVDIEGGYKIKSITKEFVEKQLKFNSKLDNEKLVKLKYYLREFIILFSSLKNTTPLLLYNYNFEMEIEKLLEFFDKNILERILEIYKSDWRSTINKINFDNAKKIILSFGMYIGLIKLLKKENISKREVSLIELESKAEDIYKQLGLEAQLALFNYEIEYNFGEKKPFYKIIPTNKFKFLSEYKKNDKNKTDIKSVEKIKKINEFKPRNYFAHAGFEINVTLVRGERNEIILKYDEEKINDIVNCVYKKI